MPDESVDVLILGAGPAGAAAAATLASAAPELRVVALEARERDHREPRPLKSGEVLMAQHRRALDALGIDVEDAPWVTHELARFRVVTPDGRDHRAEVDWEKRLSEIEKDGFDRALRAHAAALGADVRFGHRATRVDVEGTRVARVAARTAAGEVVFRPRWVLDAGGRFALVPRQLDLVDRPKEENHAVVAAMVRDFPGDRDLWEMFFFAPTPSTVELSHPLPGLARLGMGVPMSHLRGSGRDAEAFFTERIGHQPELASRFAASRGIEYTWNVAPIAYRARPHGLANVLLLGDARGYLSPFFGDGIAVALQSGLAGALRVVDEHRGGRNAAVAHERWSRRHYRWEVARAYSMQLFLYPRLVSFGFRTPLPYWLLERQLA